MPKPGIHRVILRAPAPADLDAFLEAVRRSRKLHRPWVSPPSTPQAFYRYLDRTQSDAHRGFLVIVRATGELAGVINLNNVIRGAFQNAFLGYYAFLPHAGHGFMSEGMRLAIRYAFGRLKLHRLEANIQPGNNQSRALVRRCGFVKEGFSRHYLKVCGRWADHERWALLAEDFRKTLASGSDVDRISSYNHARA